MDSKFVRTHTSRERDIAIDAAHGVAAATPIGVRVHLRIPHVIPQLFGRRLTPAPRWHLTSLKVGEILDSGSYT